MIFQTVNLDFEIGTEKIDNIFTIIQQENLDFCQIIVGNTDLDKARGEIYQYFNSLENSNLSNNDISPVKRYYSRQALKVLKNIFSKRHESLTHYSFLNQLKKCSEKDYNNISLGFAYEVLFLFRALKGTNIIEYSPDEQKPMIKSLEWSRLDLISNELKAWMGRYPNGLEEEVIRLRYKNIEYLKAKYNISDIKWNDWEWHRENVITDLNDLTALIKLTDEEREAIELANNNNIPFGITPYYLSLLDLKANENSFDYSLRTQALPLLKCVNMALEVKQRRLQSESNKSRQLPPEISITRSYPMVAIFKPMQNNTRFFCLYGERNWEINYALWKNDPIQMKKIDKALRWFNRHPEVTEVLIAGDILIYDDTIVEEILSRLADISHIERIRVSSRIPALLPIRITDSLVHLLSSYQITGRREISIMSHFEHSSEVTLDAMQGIQKMRKAGIQVYNQSIYTMGNARRFEMASLRKQLRLIGVDPYYAFNAKKGIAGERVPIARMIQEQSEETLLAPGIDRADEAVFAIPGVGKSYLKASSEHELIMILGDGSRVYEFYPSDIYLHNKKTFLYRDVPIYSFLSQLAKKGEDLKEYQSIWYYY